MVPPAEHSLAGYHTRGHERNQNHIVSLANNSGPEVLVVPGGGRSGEHETLLLLEVVLNLSIAELLPYFLILSFNFVDINQWEVVVKFFVQGRLACSRRTCEDDTEWSGRADHLRFLCKPCIHSLLKTDFIPVRSIYSPLKTDFIQVL